MNNLLKRRLIYIIGDLFACEVATLLYNIVRYLRLNIGERASYPQWSADPAVILSYIAFPAVMMAMFAILGFYNDPDPKLKSRYDLIFNAAAGSLLGSLIVYFATMVNDDFNERSLHYLLFLMSWLIFAICVSIARYSIRHVFLRHIKFGSDTYNVAVVGPPAEADEYARRLENNNARVGYNVAGIISDSDENMDIRTSYPMIAGDSIPDAINRHNIKAFIILASRDNPQASINLINRMSGFGLTILLPADFYNIITSRPKLNNIIGEPLVDITSPRLSPAAANLKRIGDIALSLTAIIVLCPLLPVIAALIKHDTRGPIFYRQERVGLHRRKFKIIKFRSMIVNAESDGPALSAADDSRITRVGSFLRKYRLDELPQFWNVLRGDMSLVGPRPEREFFLSKLLEFEPSACMIHNVRPGITSLGMVKFGYASSIEEMRKRLNYDLLYIENISLSMDIRILFHTVNTVLTGKGI